MAALTKFGIIFALFTSLLNAQYSEKKMSIGFSAVYTTSAKIYLSPNSSDAFVRNFSFPLSDIVNTALDARYRIMENLLVGLNIEYMDKTSPGSSVTFLSTNNSTKSVEVEDGFRLIPVELSLYYILPFSTERFKFLLGGGAGYYWGEHLRKIGVAEVSNIERKIAYGIQVSVSMEYLIFDYLAVRGEMKFRDPQFSVKSKYSSGQILYNGEIVKPPHESFNSKINVDGVTFIVGAAFLL